MSSVAKNTAFMTMASVAQKLISFVYFTFLARMLGAELTGKYATALAFTTIFAVLTDSGLAPTLSREVARKPQDASRLLGSVLALKIFLMMAAYLAVIVFAYLFNYPADIRALIYISGITMLFDSIHLSLYAVLRGRHNLRFEAVGMVGSQFITLVLGTGALLLHMPIVWLLVAFAIASLSNVVYAGIMLTRFEGVRIRPRWEGMLVKSLFVVAIPFALAGIFTRVYTYADTVMLSKLAGNVAVGWYSIPNKIGFAFQFIPLALVAGLYPRMSEAFLKDKKHLLYLFETAMKYLTVVALPIAVGIGLLAREFVVTLYTAEYLPSVLPLQILLASLIFAFLDFPIGAVLNSSNRQSVQTMMMGMAMVVNVIANVMWIPSYGVVGAACAALIGNAILMVGGYLALSRVFPVPHMKFLGILARALAAAAVMACMVVAFKSFMPWYFTIPVGMFVYGVAIFVFKLVSLEDLRQVKTRLLRS